jgi:hypothetical protein
VPGETETGPAEVCCGAYTGWAKISARHGDAGRTVRISDDPLPQKGDFMLSEISAPINFLEGTGLDYIVPNRWTIEHVGIRLIEAFQVIDRMPNVRGPKGAGNCWMAVVADPIPWIDQEIDERRNRSAPSNAEIARADMALDWLRALRQADGGLALLAGLWAHNRARDKSFKDLCQRKGWAYSTSRRRRELGLMWIAALLNQRATPVF